MKIVEFYRGERGNQNGDTLEQIMGYSLGAMEVDHDYIQWLLPSNEPSMLNCDAPVLTREEAKILSSDPELKAKLRQGYQKFFYFLGLRLTSDDEHGATLEVVEPTQERKDPLWWLRSFNHNMLRVTRALKSMRLTGNPTYATALYDFLQAHRSEVSSNTWAYWQNAALGDIER